MTFKRVMPAINLLLHTHTVSAFIRADLKISQCCSHPVHPAHDPCVHFALSGLLQAAG